MFSPPLFFLSGFRSFILGFGVVRYLAVTFSCKFLLAGRVLTINSETCFPEADVQQVDLPVKLK